jgi:hypothetical protein
MLDLETAKRKVLSFLNTTYSIEGDELAIREDFFIEKDYGWIFSYDSKKFFETGEFRFRRVGNHPVLILKDSGEIYLVATTQILENVLSEKIQRKI